MSDIIEITKSFLIYFFGIGFGVLLLLVALITIGACLLSLVFEVGSLFVNNYFFMCLYALIVGIVSIILVVRDRQ